MVSTRANVQNGDGIRQNLTRKKGAFLAAYGKLGNVALAAEIAKVDRRTHYDWLKNDPAYAEAFREFAAAFLDEQLRQLLAGFFVSDEKEIEKLLGVDRPLGSFNARTALTYCLGLISKEDFRDLNAIRGIRNDFAHQLHGLSFKEPSIVQKCDNLLRIRRIPWEWQKASPRYKFIAATATVMLDLANRITTIDMHWSCPTAGQLIR